MQPGKATATDVVLGRLEKLGIDTDDSDYPGEWYLLSSDQYGDDVQLYKSLSAQWPRVVSGFWQYFALVFCEYGYEDTNEDAGVWLHALQSANGHLRSEYACGAHRLQTW